MVGGFFRDRFGQASKSYYGRLSFLVRVNWTFVIRVVLGSIFLFASVDKVLNPDAFANIIQRYQIAPSFLINPTAVVLPWLELLMGLFLVFGIWLPGTVVLSNVLLLLFLGILTYNKIRGLDVHCGCFSTSTAGNPHEVWYLFREVMFLFLSGFLLLKTVFRSPSSLSAAEGRDS